MNNRYFIALIHKDPGSGYGVSFPDVPGVIATGDTLDTAIAEAGIALAFAFEDWTSALPEPRTLEALRSDASFLEDSTDAVVAAIRPSTGLIAAE